MAEFILKYQKLLVLDSASRLLILLMYVCVCARACVCVCVCGITFTLYELFTPIYMVIFLCVTTTLLWYPGRFDILQLILTLLLLRRSRFFIWSSAPLTYFESLWGPFEMPQLHLLSSLFSYFIFHRCSLDREKSSRETFKRYILLSQSTYPSGKTWFGKRL